MALEAIVTNDKNTFDVLIIGGGPAGLSAAITAKLAGLKTGFIEKNTPGGKLSSLGKLKNVLGCFDVEGSDLALAYFNHASEIGVEYIYGEVNNISTKLGYYAVYTTDYQVKYARSLIIATGIKNNNLGVAGEKEYFQKGVSYCVTCDSSLTKNKNVALVGTFDEAKTLALNAKKVYFISKFHEKNTLGNVEIVKDEIISINGNKKNVTSITLSDDKKIDVDFVFINTGGKPSVDFLTNLTLKIVDNNYIENDINDKSTSLKGVFVAGDVSKKNNRQISTAISDGAIAAAGAIKYVKELLKNKNA